MSFKKIIITLYCILILIAFIFYFYYLDYFTYFIKFLIYVVPPLFIILTFHGVKNFYIKFTQKDQPIDIISFGYKFSGYLSLLAIYILLFHNQKQQKISYLLVWIIILLFIYIYNNKMIVKLFQKFFHFTLTGLATAFLISTYLIVNFLIIKSVNFRIFIKDLVFIELNIIYQITTIFLFDFLFIFILWSIGSRIIDFFKFSQLTKAEKFIFSFAFGAIPLVFGNFLLANINLLYLKYILIILVICLLFSYRQIIENFNQINNFTVLTAKIKDYFKTAGHYGIIILFIIVTSILLFVGTIQPQPISYDALHTYYNVPKLALEQHTLPIFKYFPTANQPSNIGLLSIGALAFGGPRVLSHLSLIYLFLTLVAIYCFTQRFSDKNIGIFAVAFYFFTLAILISLVDPIKVDIPLAFFSLITIYCFIIWLKAPKWNWAIVLGSLSGFMVGIKYTAAFLILSLCLYFLYFISNRLIKRLIIKNYLFSFILSMLFSVVLFSPWLVRNKVEFNDYLYPFADLKDERFTEYTNVFHEAGQNKLGYALNFFNIYFQRGAYAPMQNFGPVFLIGFALFLLYKKNAQERQLIIILVLFFAIWLAQGYSRLWYALPILPLFSILISLAVINTQFLFRSNIIKAVFILYLLTCLISVINFSTMNSLYLSGLRSEELYLNQRIEISPLLLEVNNLIKEDDKALLVLEMKMWLIKENNKNTFVELRLENFFNHQKNSDELTVYNSLKGKNIKYIIYSNVREKGIRNLPLVYGINFVFGVNLHDTASFKNTLASIDLFHKFKRRYLKEIDCVKNELGENLNCLYYLPYES